MRKDSGLAMVRVSGAPFQLTAEQLNAIQGNCRCRLSSELQESLNSALDWYILSSGINQNASTLKEQSDCLDKVKEAAAFLHEFLTDNKNHAIYKSRIRAEKELILLRHTQQGNDEDWEVRKSFVLDEIYNIWVPELEGRIKESHEREISTIVDFERMERDIVFWYLAINRALKKVTAEMAKDKGGREEDWPLNTLLCKLNHVYENAEGRKNALERFCEEAVNALPEGNRPQLPAEAGSITKRITRLNNQCAELPNSLKKKKK